MHQGTFSVTNFHNRISCIQHGMFRTLVLNGAMSMCEQHKLGSACAIAQADPFLRFSLFIE